MATFLLALQPNIFSHVAGGIIGGISLIAIVTAVVRDRKRKDNGQPWPEWSKQDAAAQAQDKLNTWQG
jgi:hypothetical protein